MHCIWGGDMYVKVKELMFFNYGSVRKCHIIVRPQQKWEVTGWGDDIYTIARNNIDMEITKGVFDKYFVEVK